MKQKSRSVLVLLSICIGLFANPVVAQNEFITFSLESPSNPSHLDEIQITKATFELNSGVLCRYLQRVHPEKPKFNSQPISSWTFRNPNNALCSYRLMQFEGVLTTSAPSESKLLLFRFGRPRGLTLDDFTSIPLKRGSAKILVDIANEFSLSEPFPPLQISIED